MINEVNGIDFETYGIMRKFQWHEIESINIDQEDYYLNFWFKPRWGETTGSRLTLESQPDCCAHHYFTCDDDLAFYAGAKVQDFELRTQEDMDDEYGCHEVSFLIVKTNKGEFTVTAHNVHNGYYSGITLTASTPS